VSTDDIFDDLQWSDAVYLEDIGFDQDVSVVFLQNYAKT
jgi:beta-xylosidase